MTAAGAIVGINVGVQKFSRPDTVNATQASVADLSRDAEVAQLRALQASKIAAAEQQAAMVEAARDAARRKAAAAAAKAKAKAKAEAKARAKAAAAKAAREAAERAARAKDASRSTRSQDRTPIKVKPGSAKDIARRMVKARGWSSAEFSCLVKLWDRESGWRVNAANPRTPAYGIPQANPGRKMASAGADWRTSAATQIEWGLGYISGRYGTPCGAWRHFRNSGWY
jgi:hypothetical protein